MLHQETIISTHDLTIGFPARATMNSPKPVAEGINVELRRGQVVCLLGPNGSGKSTLIRTLSGLHDPLEGEIELFGKKLSDLSPKDVARNVSTVLTDRITVGNLNVYDLVSFGRSPYTGWFGSLKESDKKKIRWAIESVGAQSLVERDILRLSDGERQKVMIARALAQDTSAILLDEPTAHLDLPNRVEIIRLLRSLAHGTQKGILLSTHELDLALKAADVLWLIDRDGTVVTGMPEDLVLDGTFESAFKQDSFEFDRDTGSIKLHHPSKQAIKLSGDAAGVFWTRRALEREGHQIGESNSLIHIHIQQKEKNLSWNLSKGNEEYPCSSMQELIKTLRQKF